MMMHCFNPNMVTDYHNLPLQGFVHREFLLARFAWTLLPRFVIPFLRGTKKTRMIWTWNDRGKLEPESKTKEQCLEISNAPVPRSTGSRQRKQNDSSSGVSEADGEEDFEEEEHDNDDVLLVVDLMELNQGRKPFRAGDPWFWSSSSKPMICSSLSQRY